jgi:hypothetical protein
VSADAPGIQQLLNSDESMRLFGVLDPAAEFSL